jgi:hypothetical protein
MQSNQVFANGSKEEEIFPLTTKEIAGAHKSNDKLKHCFKCNVVIGKGLEVSLIDNTHIVCKEGRMVIPKPLQRCTVLCTAIICSTQDTVILKKL